MTVENQLEPNLSLHERQLTITVPGEIVAKEFDLAVKGVQRVASRPGFRPGKMPVSMVVSFFGDEIKKRLLEKIVEKSFDDACKKEDLIPVSDPRLEALGEINKGMPFSYRAIFQIKPQVKVNNFEGLALEIKKHSFSEGDINEELTSLQESLATFIEVKDRDTVAANDMVFCDNQVSVEGKHFAELDHKDYQIPLFAPNVPDDMKNALIGKKIGEKAHVDYRMPDDHENPELRGKNCHLTLSIVSIKERSLPKLDDDFAKDLSEKFSSLEEVKESIRTRFNLTVMRRDEFFRHDALTRVLVENNPFDVPPVLIERMAMTLINRELEAMKKEAADELVRNHWKEIWQSVQERALFRVKAELIFEALIKDLDPKVTEDEIAERMKKVRELDRDNALYSIQVEKILNAVEKSANITVKEEHLFSRV
jgi:trigger factor